MNNREMGFDILENADIDTIEKIGADNMKIDKNARDRMLKNTMSKYQKEKQLLSTAPVITSNINDEADSVSGVENYSRKKIIRIVRAVLSTAVALVIVGGSVLMMNRHKPSGSDTSDPLAIATTTVSGMTIATTQETAQTTTANAVSNIASNTTTNNTSNIISNTTSDIASNDTENASANTTISAETETPVVTTVTTENAVSDITPYKNSHPECGNISAEELESAKQRAMDRIMSGSICYSINGNDYMLSDPLWNIENATFDVNNDNIPELFVKASTLSTNATFMFIYDGSEYVQAKLNLHEWNGPCTTKCITAGQISVCPEENLIYLRTNEGHEYSQIVEISADYTFKTLFEYNTSGYYKDGVIMIERGENNLYDSSSYESFDNELRKHEWKTLEYGFYAEKNDHAVKFEEN